MKTTHAVNRKIEKMRKNWYRKSKWSNKQNSNLFIK